MASSDFFGSCNIPKTHAVLHCHSQSIAARLPHELIEMIIEETSDSDVLNNWCTATESNTALHQIALRRRWSHVRFTDRDLVAHPERADRRAKSLRVSRNAEDPRGFLYRMLGGNVQASHLAPVSHIEHLTINFQFKTGWSETRQRVVSPSIKALEYTMLKLLPQLRIVQQVSHEGSLPQEMLDIIISSLPHSFRSLKLRQKRYPQYTFYYHRSDGWRPTLRILEVYQIVQQEQESLAKAIKGLRNLRRLVLTSAECEDRPGPGEYSHISPFQSLLGYLMLPLNKFGEGPQSEEEGDCGLPLTLTSLVLSEECNSSYYRPVYVPSCPGQLYHSFNNLVDAYIDFKQTESVSNFLEWLRNAPLRRITCRIACRITREFATFHTHDSLPSPIDIGFFTQHISNIISSYKDTLERLTLLDAWNIHPNVIPELNQTWARLYSVDELVLGTKAPEYFNSRLFKTWRAKCSLREDLFSYENPHEETRWGTSIKRLRIDQAILDDYNLDGIESPALSNLKILILHPWPVYDGINAATAPLPVSLNSFKEGRLACAIVARGPLAIRVLILGRYRFWLDREFISPAGASVLTPRDDDIVYTSIGPVKIWYWQRARVDVMQHASMVRYLSGNDWSFIEEIPPKPLYKLKPPVFTVGQPELPVVGDVTLTRRNYVVLRCDETGVVGPQRSRCGVQERDLTDMDCDDKCTYWWRHEVNWARAS